MWWRRLRDVLGIARVLVPTVRDAVDGIRARKRGERRPDPLDRPMLTPEEIEERRRREREAN